MQRSVSVAIVFLTAFLSLAPRTAQTQQVHPTRTYPIYAKIYCANPNACAFGMLAPMTEADVMRDLRLILARTNFIWGSRRVSFTIETFDFEYGFPDRASWNPHVECMSDADCTPGYVCNTSTHWCRNATLEAAIDQEAGQRTDVINWIITEDFAYQAFSGFDPEKAEESPHLSVST